MNANARGSLFVVLTLWAGFCGAASCPPEQYFAPEDPNRKTPLSAPHPDFRTVQAFALHGIAGQQRRLASFYESGYLVTPCREEAAYWYDQAAQRGDDVAKAWIQRQAAIERPRDRTDGDVDKTVLRMDARGSYVAMVTINGKTVRGLVDTGASFVSLSTRTADELGVSYINGRPVQMRTANGLVKGRAITLSSINVSGITLNNVEASVSEGDHPLLIGMSFLKRLNVTSSSGTMTLAKP